jgi:Asp-tRNA(Asn)/Glu-tRNA(Gln) amidotransferase A subunit family amidase
MAPAALCTQTAGSTIRPASYCGVFGMKPSFGLLPRTGMLKTTDTLDHVGFCARSADDLALLLDALRVRGPDYPIVEARLHDRGAKPRWRVGLVKGPFWSVTEEYAREAVAGFARTLAASDVAVDEVALPSPLEETWDVHADIYDACLAYYFKPETERRPELLSPRFTEMIERGRTIAPDRYARALERQVALAGVVDALFDRYDVLLALASNGEAPKGEESRQSHDTCLLWTTAGAAVITAPVFTGPRGLPFGVQLVARKYDDLTLLHFVRLLEARGAVRPAPVVANVP